MLSKLTTALLIPAALLLAQPEKTSWDVLKAGLANTNPLTRRQAVTAVGSIGLAPEAVRLVEAALKDSDSLIRETAAAELGDMKARQSFPALKAALDDPSGEVAFAAAKSLWDMGDTTGRGFIEDVVAGQQKASESEVSRTAHDARRKAHDPKAMTVLGIREASSVLLGPFNIGVIAAEQAFKDSSTAARMLALNLLAQDCDAQTVKLLQVSLANDKSWAVKATAAKALGKCGNPETIPTLEQNLADSHAAVRFMAAAAIVRLSPKPVASAALSR
jgi:HEAT repeat protein